MGAQHLSAFKQYEARSRAVDTLKKPGRKPYYQRPMPITAPEPTCQWFENEPEAPDFCGKESIPGSSYCEEHERRSRISGSALADKPKNNTETATGTVISLREPGAQGGG